MKPFSQERALQVFDFLSENTSRQASGFDSSSVVTEYDEILCAEAKDLEWSAATSLLRKAFKFRLYPTKAQETLLENVLCTCAEVYNSFLHWRKYDFELTGKSPSYYDQQAALPVWKKSHPELCDIQSQVLQNVCKRVDLAYVSYFDRLKDYQSRKEQGLLKVINEICVGKANLGCREATTGVVEKCPGPPRSKGKGSYDSITYPQAAAFTIDQDEKCITFSKLATIKAVLHRPILGVMKTATLRRQSGKWFVTISCEVEAELLSASEKTVGIDVGLEVRHEVAERIVWHPKTRPVVPSAVPYEVRRQGNKSSKALKQSILRSKERHSNREGRVSLPASGGQGPG